MSQPDPGRGEVWLVDLPDDPEPERRAVVLSSDSVRRSKFRVVQPLSSYKAEQHAKYFPNFWPCYLIEPVPGRGLTKRVVADVFRVRAIERDRFLKHMGALEETLMEEIVARLTRLLELAEVPITLQPRPAD